MTHDWFKELIAFQNVPTLKKRLPPVKPFAPQDAYRPSLLKNLCDNKHL